MDCKVCIYKKACDVIEEHECNNIYGYLTGGVFDGCPLFKNKADFVEVVRCKDCKRCWEKRTKRNKQLMRFCMRMEGNEYPVNANDFCSYGVRKGGAE